MVKKHDSAEETEEVSVEEVTETPTEEVSEASEDHSEPEVFEGRRDGNGALIV